MRLQLCGRGTRRRARPGVQTGPHEIRKCSPGGRPVWDLAPDEISLRGLQSRRRYSKLGRVRTRVGDDSTVPASASPGVVEPPLPIVSDTGRDGSAFRVGECELVVTVGSSGSIV